MMFMILDDDGDDDDAVDNGKNKYQQKNPKWRFGILSGLSSSSSRTSSEVKKTPQDGADIAVQ